MTGQTDREETSSASTLVVPEVLSPNGAEAGELALGEYLNELMGEVRARRRPPLTKSQAIAARALAREALEADWQPELIVEGLVTTSALTMPALSYAVDQLKRKTIAANKSRLTKYEQRKQGLL